MAEYFKAHITSNSRCKKKRESSLLPSWCRCQTLNHLPDFEWHWPWITEWMSECGLIKNPFIRLARGTARSALFPDSGPLSTQRYDECAELSRCVFDMQLWMLVAAVGLFGSSCDSKQWKVLVGKRYETEGKRWEKEGNRTQVNESEANGEWRKYATH